jgi:ComF family protein
MALGLETAPLKGQWIRAARAVLDLVYPPLCIGCRAQVAAPGALCAACWQKMRFLDGPMCDCCGLPFEFDFDVTGGIDTRCAGCHASPPAYDKARAVMRYDEHSRGPILAFKHGDRLDLAPAFARWLGRGGRALLDEADLIVPVPLHPGRLWSRRFNQSAELARALAKLSRKPAALTVLDRARATPSQGAMRSAKARRRNMLGAFKVSPRHKSAIAARNILLVDDVLTTGATAEACARALKRAGAAKVLVLALARVVRPLAGDNI